MDALTGSITRNMGSQGKPTHGYEGRDEQAESDTTVRRERSRMVGTLTVARRDDHHVQSSGLPPDRLCHMTPVRSGR
jgi:hypothetical protein